MDRVVQKVSPIICIPLTIKTKTKQNKDKAMRKAKQGKDTIQIKYKQGELSIYV